MAEVLELLELSLGTSPTLRRTPEWFGWKHSTNPFGESIMLVATDADQIVGLRAFMRWDLVTPDGARIRCGRAVDTATHPDHQRRGIFRTLTESAIEAARADGVDMIFNTPNPKSGSGYLKMGWQEVGRIGVMMAPRLTRLLARPKGATTQPADMLDDAVPATALDVVDRRPRGLRTPRSAEYLEWRFAGNPNASYFKVTAQSGTVVVRANIRNGRPELVISDMFGSDLRRSLVAARRRSRASYLVGWFSQGSPERAAAIRAGVLPVPYVKALSLVARPLTELPIDVGSLRSWDFSMGDLELL